MSFYKLLQLTIDIKATVPGTLCKITFDVLRHFLQSDQIKKEESSQDVFGGAKRDPQGTPPPTPPKE